MPTGNTEIKDVKLREIYLQRNIISARYVNVQIGVE